MNDLFEIPAFLRREPTDMNAVSAVNYGRRKLVMPSQTKASERPTPADAVKMRALGYTDEQVRETDRREAEYIVTKKVAPPCEN